MIGNYFCGPLEKGGGGGVKSLSVPRHKYSHQFRMNVLFSNFINVGHSDLFNASAISLQEVCRVSVKLIGHALSQDLLFGVEGENKRVQDCVLGRAQLGLLDPAFADFDELVVQSVQSGGGAVTLAAHRHTQHATTAVTSPNPPTAPLSH